MLRLHGLLSLLKKCHQKQKMMVEAREKQLQTSLDSIEGKIANLNLQIADAQQSFNREPYPAQKDSDDLLSVIVITPSDLEDKVEQAANEMQALEAYLAELLEAKSDLETMQQGHSEKQDEIAALSQTIEDVKTSFEGSPYTLQAAVAVKDITAASLPEQIAQADEKIEALTRYLQILNSEKAELDTQKQEDDETPPEESNQLTPATDEGDPETLRELVSDNVTPATTALSPTANTPETTSSTSSTRQQNARKTNGSTANTRRSRQTEPTSQRTSVTLPHSESYNLKNIVATITHDYDSFTKRRQLNMSMPDSIKKIFIRKKKSRKGMVEFIQQVAYTVDRTPKTGAEANLLVDNTIVDTTRGTNGQANDTILIYAALLVVRNAIINEKRDIRVDSTLLGIINELTKDVSNNSPTETVSEKKAVAALSTFWLKQERRTGKIIQTTNFTEFDAQAEIEKFSSPTSS